MDRVAIKRPFQKLKSFALIKQVKLESFLLFLAVIFFVSSIGLGVWWQYTLYYYPQTIARLVEPHQVKLETSWITNALKSSQAMDEIIAQARQGLILASSSADTNDSQELSKETLSDTEYDRRLCTTNSQNGEAEWDMLDYSRPPYYEDISSSCSTYNHFTYKVRNFSMDDYNTHDLYLTSKLLADKMNREWVVFLDGKEIFRAAHYRFVPYYLWSYDDCFRIDWHYGNNDGYSIFFDESGRIIDNCPKSQNYSQ